MQFYKLCEYATLPTKAHKTDAGYDLYSSCCCHIEPGKVAKVKTEIAAIIPEGYVGLIKDRSSMGSKGIHVFAGVIDHGYTGDITVCLYNSNIEMEEYYSDDIKYSTMKENLVKIEYGDKIAQLVVVPILCEDVEEIFTLPSSDRGNNGFGSSGK